MERSFSISSWRWFSILLGAIATGSVAFWSQRYLEQSGLISPRNQPQTPIDYSVPKFDATGQSAACNVLATALSDSVYSSSHPTFNESVNSYWSLTASEITPSCVVQPATAQEVSVAIKVLKSEYDATKDPATTVKFAVRSGGHSPEAGFAGVEGGVLVETSLINEVTLSEDKKTAIVGVGARWHDVSSKLDDLGLAIVGGRNSNVGVGGLILGGGVSFFSPRYGMVCDNIDEYEIVLADGTIAQVSSTQHEDLWRALKGGTGNFGIVTRITARTFPAEKIWAGYSFWMNWQAPKVLKAFHDFNMPDNFDEYAAGPILALSYVQSLGLRPIACSLAYTKSEAWAPVFKGFKSIWQVFSTAKVQSLSDATKELNSMAPYGQRQFQATTTIKNDLATFNAFREIYDQKLKEVKSVKAGVWSLVYQPLSAAVTRKGSPNVLGLETRRANETLIIVLVSVSWANAKDDELVHRVSREMISLGEDYAESKGTADPYRYLNYAASGQDPFSGYGEDNKHFLQDMSRKYDPDGFYQRAKQGGFKLDLY